MSSVSPSMEDFPGNVIVDILTRLPVKTIIHCKSVCKKWREYISESYFINLHLSRSPAGVMIHHNCQPEDFTYQRVDEPGVLKWLEIEREGDDTHLHHDHVTGVDLNLVPAFHNTSLLQVGSVNGLVCLWQYCNHHDNTYICNPITREYMILPRQRYYRDEKYATVTYGFGVGLRTTEYKVIRIFQTDLQYFSPIWPRVREAEIYTLGTGQWRSLGHVPYWLTEFPGPFLNGCVYWAFRDNTYLDSHPRSPEKLCAFDFDNETFHLLPSPPSTDWHGNISRQKLGVLKGCLCQCDSSIFEFIIWVMKEYGIKKCWHKEVVIKQSIISPGLDWLIREPVTVLEGLEDGTIVMLLRDTCLLVYSPQKNTIEKREMFRIFFTGMAYRPSLLKLRSFDSERVNVL